MLANMMYGTGMEAGWGLFGVMAFLSWFVWLVVGTLLAMWLWKKVQKEK